MDGQDPTHVLVETSALDLLLAMVRIAPDGKGQGEALSGYRSAYDGNTPPDTALTKSKEYQRGYFCCNQNPMTTSERQAEIWGLISIMIEIEREASNAPPPKKYKICSEHPDTKGSLDCAECCAKLSKVNKAFAALAKSAGAA